MNIIICCVCVFLSHRLLAEEDAAGGPADVAAAAGELGAELYTAGGIETAGFEPGKLQLYLIRKVCKAGV